LITTCTISYAQRRNRIGLDDDMLGYAFSNGIGSNPPRCYGTELGVRS
jgi:hypothetical protein